MPKKVKCDLCQVRAFCKTQDDPSLCEIKKIVTGQILAVTIGEKKKLKKKKACPKCQGSGDSPRTYKTCPECKGRGYIEK